MKIINFIMSLEYCYKFIPCHEMQYGILLLQFYIFVQEAYIVCILGGNVCVCVCGGGGGWGGGGGDLNIITLFENL